MLNVKKTASVTLAMLISLAGQAAYAHHHPQHDEGTCQRKPVYAEGSESTVLYYNYHITSDCSPGSMGRDGGKPPVDTPTNTLPSIDTGDDDGGNNV